MMMIPLAGNPGPLLGLANRTVQIGMEMTALTMVPKLALGNAPQNKQQPPSPNGPT